MSSGRSSSDQAKFLLPFLPSKPCVKLLPPEFVPTLTRGSVQSAYLYDVLDHISTSTQNLTYYEKVLSRSHTNFLTQISIQCEQPFARYSGWRSLPSRLLVTATNTHINDLLSKMTVFGTTVIPMNLITGIWGLNVLVPGKSGTTLSWFFGVSVSSAPQCQLSG